jgi:hypothetical protein
VLLAEQRGCWAIKHDKQQIRLELLLCGL